MSHDSVPPTPPNDNAKNGEDPPQSPPAVAPQPTVHQTAPGYAKRMGAGQDDVTGQWPGGASDPPLRRFRSLESRSACALRR